MTHFQRVLEGENYVTASLVPVAVYQIRKNYQEVIDDDNTLSVVKALTETLLADFDKRYHTSGGNKLVILMLLWLDLAIATPQCITTFLLPPFWIPEPNCY